MSSVSSVVRISRGVYVSVNELVLGVFVSPHSFCNSFNFLSGSRVRARIGLNSVHSVILLLLRENEKQARRADRPQAGVSEA